MTTPTSDGRRHAADLLAGRPAESAVLHLDSDVVDTARLRLTASNLIADLHLEQKALIAIEGPRRSLRNFAAYLGALSAGHAVLLIDNTSRARTDQLLDVLRPEVVFGETTVVNRRRGSQDLHPDLALLMPTSGSTGRPKLTRLSYTNLLANGRSIAKATGIDAADRAATTLPLDYAFGLSIVNSHLVAGASLLLSDAPAGSDRADFEAAAHGVTTWGMTPNTAHAVSVRPRRLPATVRSVLVAGGPSRPSSLVALQGRFSGPGEVHSMYGQCEATARIACLPPAELLENVRSVGYPVPGCDVDIVDDDGLLLPPGTTGEIRVRGANVMLGYARTRADCARGDDCAGTWLTGDLGRIVDGRLEVHGRRDRRVKIFGRSVDLDLVEESVMQWTDRPCVTLANNDLLVVVVESRVDQLTELGDRLAAETGLPASLVRIRAVAKLPLTASGKKDRAAAAAEVSKGRVLT